MSSKSSTGTVAAAASNTKPTVPADIAQKAEYWAKRAKETAPAWEQTTSTKTGGSGGDPCALVSKLFTAATQVATGNWAGAGKTLFS